MKAAIITIGDEILVGQTIDTNSAYIAQKLRVIGMSIIEIRSVSDHSEEIINTMNDLLKKSDILFITGGLGPTKDDITKKVLCHYFHDELKLNPLVLERIINYFASLNREVLDVHRQQAYLPSKAKIVLNDLGTASGMWFNTEGKHVISMPGVPFEMKGLVNKIIPEIQGLYGQTDFYHKTILFQGIGESTLAKSIPEIEKEAEEKEISIAYLPSIGIVKIRFTGKIKDKAIIEKYIRHLEVLFPKNFFGYETDTLEGVVGKLLLEKNQTIGTVESCTSGNLAARIVSVPGASAYYEGSLLTYSYALKSKLLGIDNALIIEKGAVSEEVVSQMAKFGREKLNVDLCLATSGIAGPDGGTPDKPVGTVWIALAAKNQIIAKQFNFKQNRERNIELSVSYALNMLRRFLLEN